MQKQLRQEFACIVYTNVIKKALTLVVINAKAIEVTYKP